MSSPLIVKMEMKGGNKQVQVLRTVRTRLETMQSVLEQLQQDPGSPPLNPQSGAQSGEGVGVDQNRWGSGDRGPPP